MAKRDALRGFVFYTQDYFGDVLVRRMPLNLRMIWVEMFFLMDQSPRRGVLLKKNGEPYSIADLADITRGTADEVEQAIAWVIREEIADKDRTTKSLVCRRMIREGKKLKLQTTFGHQGGNPALTKNYNVPGFVYLIRRRSDRAIKIGIAVNVMRRLYKLRQAYKGDHLTLIGFTPVPDMGAKEAELHAKFTLERVEGEWFKLSQEKLDTLFSTLPFTLKGNLPLKAIKPDPDPDPDPDPILKQDSLIQLSPQAATDASAVLTLGEFGRVHVTAGQYEKLKTRLNGHLETYINRFDRWVNEAPKAKAHGVQRQDRHAYESILNWYDRDVKEGRVQQGRAASIDWESPEMKAAEERHRKIYGDRLK